MKNGSPAHLELRKILLNFEPVLNSWISQCELGKMNDPFETIYSENYAPGNASVIYASIYNLNRDPDTLRNCYKMIERSVELLKDRNSVSPFCRVFLLHYSLMAIILLPEDERKNVKDKFGAFYSAYI